MTQTVRGFIVRNAKGKHLASGRWWFSRRFESAWVHVQLPTTVEVEDWELKPTEFCKASWSKARGNLREGSWETWA